MTDQICGDCAGVDGFHNRPDCPADIDVPQAMRTASDEISYGMLLTDTVSGQQWLAESPGLATASRDVKDLASSGIKGVTAQLIRQRVTRTDWEFVRDTDKGADHG